MRKLLLADGTGNFIKPIIQQLKREYSVLTCTDDQQVLSKLKKFDPDIMLLDLQLTGVGGMAILRALRGAGFATRVIVITPLGSPHILCELAQLDVSCVHLTTVSPNAIIQSIRQIGNRIDNGDELPEWDPAIEVDKLLLDLCFCLGRGRYTVIREAVLYVYDHPDCFMTKCLYPDLAARFNSTITGVEKAIRDAIKDAWDHGDSGLWRLYLHKHCDRWEKYPSNEVFLAYAAHALHCLQRQFEKPQRMAK